MVMVPLALPMQHGMRHFFHFGKRGGLPGDGKGLPERRKKEENGENAAHRASLVEDVRVQKAFQRVRGASPVSDKLEVRQRGAPRRRSARLSAT